MIVPNENPPTENIHNEETELVDIYNEHLVNHRVPYDMSQMTRVSKVAKRKLVMLKGRYGQKSDTNVIETLIAVYEQVTGQEIK